MRFLTTLSQSFTPRDNPHGNRNPNIAFQRDLDELLETDGEYRGSPSLPRLCYLVAELIHRREKLEIQSQRLRGSTSNQFCGVTVPLSIGDRSDNQTCMH